MQDPTEADCTILQTWLDAWGESRMRIPDGASMNNVRDLAQRLGLRLPVLFTAFFEASFRQLEIFMTHGELLKIVAEAISGAEGLVSTVKEVEPEFAPIVLAVDASCLVRQKHAAAVQEALDKRLDGRGRPVVVILQNDMDIKAVVGTPVRSQ